MLAKRVEIVTINDLIEEACLRKDLASYDPYDVWTTTLGTAVKDLFNRNRKAGLLPAVLITLYDVFLNNRLRLGYKKREYPIVRAFAGLSLLNLYEVGGSDKYLEYVRMHLDWLLVNRCPRVRGWGLGWRYPVSKGLIYDEKTPFSTVTPYPLEAFVRYQTLVGDGRYRNIIVDFFKFFDEDIKVMEESDLYLSTSYANFKDRVAYNAVSYTMYSLSLTATFIADAKKVSLQKKILKLYNFLVEGQNEDGSWFYAPQQGSFIDCFHSCFVLKNIFKTGLLVDLPEVERVLSSGYAYLKSNLYDDKTGLFRRFSLKNKPGVIRFDLYDNAEMLNLALLLGDGDLADRLVNSIFLYFVVGKGHIYSKIDLFGFKRDLNTLRWAVMPFIYALSSYAKFSKKN